MIIHENTCIHVYWNACVDGNVTAIYVGWREVKGGRREKEVR